MSNSIAPGSSADVNVKVTALTTNPNVPVTYKTIILKKNLVNGVNTLTQEMIYAQNTKYVVKYDYTIGNVETKTLTFTNSQLSSIVTPEYTNKVAADAAYAQDPSDENRIAKEIADAAYVAIGSIQYYAWQSITLEAGHALHLYGRSFRLNDSKSSEVPTERGIIFAENDMTVYIGCIIASRNYRYDKYITIPSNCVLEFDGGSLSNGIPIGTDTKIRADKVAIFTNIIIRGTWNVTDIYSKWFGFVEGSQNDNKNQFQNLLSVASSSVHNNIYIEDGTFYTSIVDSDFGFEIPSNTDVYNNAHICQLGTDRGKYAVFSVYDSENVTFRGGKITGDNEVHIGAITEHAHCIYLIGARNTTIENVVCEKAGGDGIDIQALYSDYEHGTITGHCYNITIKNVTCDYNARQGISVEGAIGCVINTCTITNTGQGAYTPKGPWYGIDIEPWYEGQLVRDLTIKNCNIRNCKGGGIKNFIKDTSGNIVIENNDLQGIGLFGCEYSTIITGNIINSLYASSTKEIIVDNNKINNYFYFEGFSENNKITNNVITVDAGYSSFAGCIVKNNIINSRIRCYANGAKFENCIISIQTDENQSMEAMGILEFYNCTISINKPIWLNTNGGAIIKNSILDRRITDTSPLMVFTTDSYPQDPVKLISNRYINAPTSLDKVQNWGSANPNYIISDTEVDVVTQQPTKPYVGQSYFNGTKPVWWNGTSWVDATGIPV